MEEAQSISLPAESNDCSLHLHHDHSDTSKSDDKDASLKEEASQEAKEDASEGANEDSKKEPTTDIEMNTVTARVDTPGSADSTVDKFRGFSDVKPKGEYSAIYSVVRGATVSIGTNLSLAPYLIALKRITIWNAT